MKISHRKKRLYYRYCIIALLAFFFWEVGCLYRVSNDAISSLLISLGSSLLFFIFLNFVIQPTIKISEEIRKVVIDKDNYFFEYAVRNLSYFLELRNISVFFIINTPYNDKQDNHSGKDKLVFPAIACIPYIIPRKDEYLNIIIPSEDIRNYLECKKDTYKHVLEKIKDKDKVIGIDLFLDKHESDFQIVINGYSSFSGVNKTYISEPYKKENIKIGSYWNRGKVTNCKNKRTMNLFKLLKR